MTSISDRCKTAREEASPGPWRHAGGFIWGEGGGMPVVSDYLEESGDLIALAPEAADEVIRLHSEIEAMRERCIRGMDHIKAKDQITPIDGARLSELGRKLSGLNCILNPNGDTNDLDHP